ncbi:hypothetical protein PMAC_002753 [Pneumocystis sp. 'macacae']|nr:hypothetical protein PMAC_002753 [Pneumocystis sp. 'macacae']
MMELYDIEGEEMKQIDSSACLVLEPLNETFERKCLRLPVWPQTLRMGRQTSSRTVPSSSNGFFDSKVLSRAHAEVWMDTTGSVFIRDTQSSNGTFLNGRRLSAEGQVSDPVALHTGDVLELGIDILNEEDRSIVHRGVVARIEYIGQEEMHSFNHSDMLNNTWNSIDSSDSASMTWTGKYRAVTPYLYGTNTYKGTLDVPSVKSPVSSPFAVSGASSAVSAIVPLDSVHEEHNYVAIDDILQILSESIKITEMQASDLTDMKNMLNSIQEATDKHQQETHLSAISVPHTEIDSSMGLDKNLHRSSSSLVNLEVLAMKQREIDEKTIKIKQLETERKYEQTCEQTCRQVVELLFKEQQNEKLKNRNKTEIEYTVGESEINKSTETEKKEDPDSELKILQWRLEATKKELEMWKYRTEMTEKMVEQSTYHIAALLKTPEIQIPSSDSTDNILMGLDPWCDALSE